MTAMHDGEALIDLNAIVGQNIRAIAARREISQTELGRKLGLTSGAISMKYRGARLWTFVDIARVAEIFDITPWSLFEPVQYEKGPNLREVGADLPIQYIARDSNPEPTDSASAQVISLQQWRQTVA